MTKHRLFWPLLLLGVLLVSNLYYAPNFFSIRMQDGHLYGNLIDILVSSAPLIMVAVGMTLVIATGGVDLSVGTVVAISGALACLYISEQPDQGSLAVVLTAVAIALGAALIAGIWNGMLVSWVGVQPIIATLILMVSGRGIALAITDGQNIRITSDTYKLIGGGYALTLPFSIFIVAAMILLTTLLTRRTALGLLVESVGGNRAASRLVGIKATSLVMAAYIFCAVCAGIAGLMESSNVLSADGNSAGLWLELDAILAVVIGGTALTGGRFSIAGSVIGALIIETLTLTIITAGVSPQATLVYKAGVVLAVCLLQSPAFRAKVFRRRRPPPPAAAPAAPKANVEVPA